MENQEIENLIEERQKQDEKEKNEIVQRETEQRKEVSIGQVSLDDIHVKLNTNKSYEEQAEDVIGAMATAKLTEEGDDTLDVLKKQKSDELKSKGQAKVKDAETRVADAETKNQNSVFEQYKDFLAIFAIKKSLPKTHRKIAVVLLTLPYVFGLIFIHTPLGLMNMFINCLDNLFVTYEEKKENIKPRIKFVTWLMIGVLIAGAICLTVLKILNKI